MTYNSLQGIFTTMIGFVTWPPFCTIILYIRMNKNINKNNLYNPIPLEPFDQVYSRRGPNQGQCLFIMRAAGECMQPFMPYSYIHTYNYYSYIYVSSKHN